MKTIHFYRDLSISCKNHIGLILLLGLIAPLASWRLIDDLLIGPNGIVLTLIILCWFMIITMRRLYYLITDIANVLKPTLSLSEQGLDYPYLLTQPERIDWFDIENIEYIIDQDKSDPAYSPFILLTLKPEVNIEKLKRVYGAGMQRTWQREYYDRKVIVISEESLRGYSVKDAMDQIATYWKYATNQISLPTLNSDSHTIQYIKTKRIQFLVVGLLLNLVVFIAIIMIGMTQLNIDVLSTLENLSIATQWQDLNAQSIATMIWFSIICIFGIFSITEIFKKSMIGVNHHEIAIDFDSVGIACINDHVFDRTVMWNDVKNIYIEELVERKTGKKVPVLIIEFSNKKYRIYNELKDINIYEIYEVMTGYLAGSNSPS